jgi:hypothetical protein
MSINQCGGNSPASPPFDRVYLDSVAAWHALRNEPRFRDAEFFSFSPAVLAAAEGSVRSAERHLTAEQINALESASLDLANALASDTAIPIGWRLLLAHAACVDLHPALACAACLDLADFARRTLVVQIDGLSFELGRRFNSLLGTLSAGDSHLQIYRLHKDRLPLMLPKLQQVPPPATRLAFAARTASLPYSLAKKLPAMTLGRSRGTILVASVSELIKESAYALFRLGYRIREIGIAPDREPNARLGKYSEIADRVQRVTEAIVRSALGVPAAAAIGRWFGELALAHVARYESARLAWNAETSKCRDLQAVLCNANILGKDLAALSDACREARRPLVVGQHGITIEINARTAHYWPTFESSFADLTLAFNPEAARLLNNNEHRRGTAASVGLPADYSVGGRLRGLRNAPPIWYVSTSLYRGAIGSLAEGASDHDKWRFETALVEGVFAKLPHRVLFKPYPSSRYIDRDPIELFAERYNNIEVLRSAIDQRYIVGGARVLVTSRAWSTISWCLATGRPTVYIDLPHQAPLHPDARSAMKSAVYLFEAAATDFHDRLRAFLSRPISEIDADWTAMAPARARFMSRFIGESDGRAGIRAAGLVDDLLRQH